MSVHVETVDTVVVGSGPAGLASARRLALGGQKVVLLERAKHLGGHLLPFQRHGATFEVGVHYLADTAVGSAFEKACSALDVHIPMAPLDDAFDELRLNGGRRVLVHGDLNRYMQCLLRAFPKETSALFGYKEAVEMVWRELSPLEFPLSIPRFVRAALARPSLLGVGRLVPLTLRDFLQRELRCSPELTEVLAYHHLIIGVPPSRLSALVYLAIHAYYFQGACFPVGGGAQILEKLLHPEVHYQTSENAFVSKRTDGAEGFEVRTSTGRVRSRSLIWTPDPKLLRTCSDLDLPTLLRHRLAHVEYPHSYVVGYYGTRSPLESYGLDNRNYCLHGPLGPEAAYECTSLSQLAEQAPLFVSTGSLRDPSAVQGSERIHGVFQAMFLSPPDPKLWGGTDADRYHRRAARDGYFEVYKSRKAELLAALTQRIEKALPSLAGELTYQELGTPLTHRRFLHSVGLGGLGYSPTVFDTLIGRPSFRSGIGGLYFAGQYVRPAHGLSAALVNGTRVAEIVVDEQR